MATPKEFMFGTQTAAEFAWHVPDSTEKCLRRDRTEVIPYWFSGFTF